MAGPSWRRPTSRRWISTRAASPPVAPRLGCRRPGGERGEPRPPKHRLPQAQFAAGTGLPKGEWMLGSACPRSDK